MAKKTGMGSTPLAWVQDTSQKAAPETPRAPTIARRKPERKRAKQEPANGKPAEKEDSEVRKSVTSKVPKFETFEVKLSILLRGDQLEFLEKLTREVMKKRDKENRQERITKNTVVRACLDALREAKFDTANIPDEEELRQRIRAGVRS